MGMMEESFNEWNPNLSISLYRVCLKPAWFEMKETCISNELDEAM